MLSHRETAVAVAPYQRAACSPANLKRLFSRLSLKSKCLSNPRLEEIEYYYDGVDFAAGPNYPRNNRTDFAMPNVKMDPYHWMQLDLAGMLNKNEAALARKRAEEVTWEKGPEQDFEGQNWVLPPKSVKRRSFLRVRKRALVQNFASAEGDVAAGCPGPSSAYSGYQYNYKQRFDEYGRIIEEPEPERAELDV